MKQTPANPLATPPGALTDAEKRRRLEPPGGRFEHYHTQDRNRLRYGIWKAKGTPKGTVIVLPGRREFVEKYYETIADLQDRGFVAVVLDWRGQGGSGRPLPNQNKNHVESFDILARDFRDFVAHAAEKRFPKPWTVIAHSMGAHLFLKALLLFPDLQKRIDKAVLTAPMMGINFSPLPTALVRWLIERARKKGRMTAYATFQKDYGSIYKGPKAMEKLTSDQGRFEDEAWLLQRKPQLGLGGVTYGWLDAALKSMKELNASDLAGRITMPMIVIIPGTEKVVDNKATEAFVKKLRNANIVRIQEARHEILKENDRIRKMFWNIFDHFVH